MCSFPLKRAERYRGSLAVWSLCVLFFLDSGNLFFSPNTNFHWALFRFLLCPVVIPQRSTRPVSAPVFSQAALAEAGIPMAPLEQPQTSTPIRTGIKEEGKLEVTLEVVEPSRTEDKVVFQFLPLRFQVLTASQVLYILIPSSKNCCLVKFVTRLLKNSDYHSNISMNEN